MYCSSRCCAAAWQTRHCLLCTGKHNDTRASHMQSMDPPCPYTAPFDLSHLLKWPHDRRIFGWLANALSPAAADQAASTTSELEAPSVTGESAAADVSGALSETAASEREAEPRVASADALAMSAMPGVDTAQLGPSSSSTPIAATAEDPRSGAASASAAGDHGTIPAAAAPASSSAPGATPPAPASGTAPERGPSAGEAGDCAHSEPEPSEGPLSEGPRLVHEMLPLPPWAVGVQVDDDQMTQFEAYTQGAEMDAMRVAAQAIALTMCTAMHCAALVSGRVPARTCGLATPQQRVALSRCRAILGSHDAGALPPLFQGALCPAVQHVAVDS